MDTLIKTNLSVLLRKFIKISVEKEKTLKEITEIAKKDDSYEDTAIEIDKEFWKITNYSISKFNFIKL